MEMMLKSEEQIFAKKILTGRKREAVHCRGPTRIHRRMRQEHGLFKRSRDLFRQRGKRCLERQPGAGRCRGVQGHKEGCDGEK